MSKWTIMVYMNGKNNLEHFGFTNFDQLSAIGTTDEVKILVQFIRPQSHSCLVYGNWTGSLRFCVDKGMKPLEEKSLMKLGSTDTGNAATLASFVQWGMENYKADNYMLVLWGHAWEGCELTLVPDEFVQSMSWNSVCPDFENQSVMYISDIQNSLKDILGERHLDIIGFDACLMAMVETAFAMRDVGKIMVASEEVSPFDGWAYQLWLKTLIDNPGLTPTGLAQLIVDTFGKTYSSNATLSAVDLTTINVLADKISDFSDYYSNSNNDEEKKAIGEARNNCKNYGGGGMPMESNIWLHVNTVDCLRFFTLISQTARPVEDLKHKAKEVCEEINKRVLANYASDDHKDDYDYGSHGLAIFFPKTLFEYKCDPIKEIYLSTVKKQLVEFVQKTKWARFLMALGVIN